MSPLNGYATVQNYLQQMESVRVRVHKTSDLNVGRLS